MAMVRDLTPKFREAVRAAALANGFDEVTELSRRSISVMCSVFSLRTLFLENCFSDLIRESWIGL